MAFACFWDEHTPLALSLCLNAFSLVADWWAGVSWVKHTGAPAVGGRGQDTPRGMGVNRFSCMGWKLASTARQWERVLDLCDWGSGEQPTQSERQPGRWAVWGQRMGELCRCSDGLCCRIGEAVSMELRLGAAAVLLLKLIRKEASWGGRMWWAVLARQWRLDCFSCCGWVWVKSLGW